MRGEKVVDRGVVCESEKGNQTSQTCDHTEEWTGSLRRHYISDILNLVASTQNSTMTGFPCWPKPVTHVAAGSNKLAARDDRGRVGRER